MSPAALAGGGVWVCETIYSAFWNDDDFRVIFVCRQQKSRLSEHFPLFFEIEL
jgi:hypothetical protein